MDADRIRIDRVTWARWRMAMRAFAASEVGGRARLRFAALLGLLLAINGLNVLNSYVGRDFMTAIEARSWPRFVSMAILYVGVFGASTVAAVVYRYTEERLGLLWREWLTGRLVGRYLEGRTYYWLREQSDVANPDQRMADDVRTFTSTTLSLALVFLNGTFTIVAFSGVMWSISPLLFGTALAYAALGSGLTLVFGRPLIWLNYVQADREASLRAELVHVRENAEAVAILDQEGPLADRLRLRIAALVDNMRHIIAVNRNLGFFTTGYNYLIQIIPILIVAPLFIRGEAEFGVISQSSMAFSHLLGAFSLVVTQFQQISSYAVVLARLSDLGEGVEGIRLAPALAYDDGRDALGWERVTLRAPHDGAVLVDALEGVVAPGTRTLVTGAGEAAPAALFRATAGLWPAGEGRIVRPPAGAILFLPERPYLPPGTLRQALLRAGRERAAGDDEIRAVLGALRLGDVVERAGGLDVERDWDDLLSLGEQQRVSIARIALASPRFALLDRPGTLLPAAALEEALDLLARRSITAVAFVPGDAVPPLRHDARLELLPDGRWIWHAEGEASRMP